MAKRTRQIPPAFKHGIYSKTAVLPEDDAAGFEKLRNALIVEWEPQGAVEKDIVNTLARLCHRKNNLAPYLVAKMRVSQIEAKNSAFDLCLAVEASFRPEELVPQSMRQQTPLVLARSDWKPNDKKPASSAPGITIESLARFEYFETELAFIDRIDGMIQRCLKNLLLVRGVKSVSSPSNSNTNILKISGPSG